MRTFEPVALPQLAWSDALKATCLEVGSAGHRTTVDLVDDAILRWKVKITQCPATL